MIANFATKSAISMKKEIGVILIVLSVLLLMPLAAVMAVTDVGELDNGDGATLYTGDALAANTYIYGYCTFWAAQRRIEIGMPIPNTWGDAITWNDRAAAEGYVVDHIPKVGAIMQTDRGSTGEGHVAFVEEVYPDGSWRVSEMNVKGWNILSERTLTVQRIKDFSFIH